MKKSDIADQKADQKVKTVIIAIVSQDQIQTEAMIQIIIEIVPTQTLGADTSLLIIHKIHHTIGIEIVQAIEIEIIPIIDPETTPTINHITTITIIYPVITPAIEKTTT